MTAPIAAAERLLAFVDASPTPFHVCAAAAKRLEEVGFTRHDLRDQWQSGPQRGYAIVGGSLIAWHVGDLATAHQGFRVVGAHTDSPNLRLKQNHDSVRTGSTMVALEPYGGPLLESWLDLDLGIAGRVFLHGGRELLVRIDEPL